MVPIEKFENLFSDRILERAAGYTNEESIDMLAIHSSLIKARVFGTYPYTVDIEFEDDQITSMYCSCPYDYGYCKHLAAVLMYYLDFEEDFPDEVYERGEIMKEQEPPALKTMLENASREDLLQFIQTAIKQEPRLFDQAKLFFMPEDSRNSELLYEEMIDREIQEIIEDGGYDGWKISSNVNTYLNQLMESVSASGNFKNFISLALVVARKANELVELVDDSYGQVYETGSSAFWDLEKMIAKPEFAEEDRQFLFKKLLDFLERDDVYTYGLGTDAWGVLAKITRSREELEILANRMNKNVNGSHYSDRRQTAMINILEAMQHVCTEEEIESFAWENRDISEIRQSLIQNYLNVEDYQVAKELANEGLKSAEKDDKRRAAEAWEEALLNIATLENNKADILKWAWHVLTRHRLTIDNYRLLKTNTAAKDRNKIISQLLENDVNLSTHQILQLYAEEKLYDKMLKVLEEASVFWSEFHYLDEFADYLLPNYKPEVVKLYMDRIRGYVDKNLGRKHYKTAARYLMKLKEMGAAAESKALAEELRNKYSNRPAMLQEFRGL